MLLRNPFIIFIYMYINSTHIRKIFTMRLYLAYTIGSNIQTIVILNMKLCWLKYEQIFIWLLGQQTVKHKQIDKKIEKNRFLLNIFFLAIFLFLFLHSYLVEHNISLFLNILCHHNNKIIVMVFQFPYISVQLVNVNYFIIDNYL